MAPSWHADEGYAVDVKSGVVHRRYAEHAIGLPRTRHASGVIVLLGHAPTPCGDCFGVPVTDDAASAWEGLTADDLLADRAPAPSYSRRRRKSEPEPEADVDGGGS